MLALVVRLPGLVRPLTGNFATRNVVQAMAARNWVRGEAPWWQPTLDCLSDGSPAWHFVEVPCSAYLSATLWNAFGGSLDAWGRATAIAWSLISVGLIFDIAYRRIGSEGATAAGLAMAIAPISVIYGQSFLLEPSVVALTLVAWRATEQYVAGPRPRPLLLLGLALTFLWLTKVYMLALAGPLAWLLLNCEVCLSKRARALFAATLLIAALPTVWWCIQVWLLARPGATTTGRVYYSLLGSATEHGFPHPLLGDLGFYWRLVADLCTVVLTPVGALLIWLGVKQVAWRNWWPVAVVMLLLVVVMPRKFHEMNYYHLLFLPVWAGIIGMGWHELSRRFARRRWLAPLMVATVMLFSLRYSLRPAFLTPNEDRSVVIAAEALQELAAPHDRIIASHGTTLDLLYYCDRHGWTMPLGAMDVSERIEAGRREGARWMVISGERPLDLPKPAEAALHDYPVVAQGDGYRVYRLSAAGETSPDRSAARTAIPAAPGAK